MIEGQKSFMSAENMRAASLPTVCLWILDAWRGLPAEIIARSLKKSSIFNPMDGTEDEILLDETERVPTTPVDEEDEDEGVCVDHLTSKELQRLFGVSDEDFTEQGTLLTLERSHQVNKSQ